MSLEHELLSLLLFPQAAEQLVCQKERIFCVEFVFSSSLQGKGSDFVFLWCKLASHLPRGFAVSFYMSRHKSRGETIPTTASH